MADVPDHLDRLADLFLSDPDGLCRTFAPPSPPLKLHRPTMIEVLLIGHLPVRAALWAPQYAQRIASEQEPVALLTLDATGRPTIEFYSADASLQRTLMSAHPDQPETLRSIIHRATPHIKRWMILPPPGSAGDAALLPIVDRVTILTGADEVATVNAYTRLKELHTAAADPSETPGSPGTPDTPGTPGTPETPHTVDHLEFAIAFLGSAADRAHEAGERLERALSLHLGLSLAPRIIIPRIEPLDTVLRRSPHYTPGDDCTPSIGEVIEWIHDPEPVANTDALETEASTATPPRTMPPVIETIRLQPRIHHHSSEQPVGRVHPLRAAVESPPEVAPEVAPESPPEAAPAVDQAQPRDPATSLAAFIRGLSGLGIPCPESARVEVASADDGAIHLVAREGDLASLARAEAWAKKNANLIAMAFPNRTIDPAGRVVRHLVTDTPARFADLYDSDYRLHIIAPVDVDGHRGWYSAPLNSPRA